MRINIKIKKKCVLVCVCYDMPGEVEVIRLTSESI